MSLPLPLITALWTIEASYRPVHITDTSKIVVHGFPESSMNLTFLRSFVHDQDGILKALIASLSSPE